MSVCARLLGEVHEDEPLPHLAVHRHEAVVGLVDPEELALLKDEGAAAVEIVLPAVVLAGELPAGSTDLLGRVVGPHQLVAAVAADVVEGADLVVHAPDDDQRGARDRELLGEEAALSPELLDPPDVQPGPLEDRPRARARRTRARSSSRRTPGRFPARDSAPSRFPRGVSGIASGLLRDLQGFRHAVRSSVSFTGPCRR